MTIKNRYNLQLQWCSNMYISTNHVNIGHNWTDHVTATETSEPARIRKYSKTSTCKYRQNYTNRQTSNWSSKAARICIYYRKNLLIACQLIGRKVPSVELFRPFYNSFFTVRTLKNKNVIDIWCNLFRHFYASTFDNYLPFQNWKSTQNTK
jgi:hypothetical protein